MTNSQIDASKLEIILENNVLSTSDTQTVIDKLKGLLSSIRKEEDNNEL